MPAHAELALIQEPAQPLEQLDLEDVAQDLDREQVAPPVDEGVLAEPTAGDEAVCMGMVLEPLSPGVEHGQYARAEALACRDLEDGLGGGGEEGLESVDTPLSREERAERGRDGEDQVEIVDREQVRLLGLGPQGLIETTAARTVSVAAGVVGEVLVAAMVADGEVSAEAAGAAGECGPRPWLARDEDVVRLRGRAARRQRKLRRARRRARYFVAGFRLSSGLVTSASQVLAKWA